MPKRTPVYREGEWFWAHEDGSLARPTEEQVKGFLHPLTALCREIREQVNANLTWQDGDALRVYCPEKLGLAWAGAMLLAHRLGGRISLELELPPLGGEEWRKYVVRVAPDSDVPFQNMSLAVDVVTALNGTLRKFVLQSDREHCCPNKEAS